MRTDTAIARAALDLKHVASPHWEDFLKALDAYNQELVEGCIQAPPDKILVAQGRAQQCVSLMAVLKDAAGIVARSQPAKK